MKTVIGLYGTANVGKSGTIKTVDTLIKKEFPDFVNVGEQILPNNGDIRTCFKVNGIIIGIESQGDPNSRLFISLKLFVEIKCEIIICATRTRGETVKAVEELGGSGYQVKWFDKTKSTSEDNQDKENLETATQILNMVKEIVMGNT